MFTGIIQHVGKVARLHAVETGKTIWLDPQRWSHSPSSGESIAVNGCCLTLVNCEPEGALRFDVIHQTLQMTTLGALSENDSVNLEHAATPTTMLGGHIVQGHVDGVAVVQQVDKSSGEWRVRIEPPDGLMEFLIPQGSICVDGVSLTIAALAPDWFEVALIPTTLRLTNLSRLTAGSRVNLEADCIAKTVVSWLKRCESRGQ